MAIEIRKLCKRHKIKLWITLLVFLYVAKDIVAFFYTVPTPNWLQSFPFVEFIQGTAGHLIFKFFGLCLYVGATGFIFYQTYKKVIKVIGDQRQSGIFFRTRLATLNKDGEKWDADKKKNNHMAACEVSRIVDETFKPIKLDGSDWYDGEKYSGVYRTTSACGKLEPDPDLNKDIQIEHFLKWITRDSMCCIIIDRISFWRKQHDIKPIAMAAMVPITHNCLKGICGKSIEGGKQIVGSLIGKKTKKRDTKTVAIYLALIAKCDKSYKGITRTHIVPQALELAAKYNTKVILARQYHSDSAIFFTSLGFKPIKKLGKDVKPFQYFYIPDDMFKMHLIDCDVGTVPPDIIELLEN